MLIDSCCCCSAAAAAVNECNVCVVALASNTSGSDQQFFQISFTPAATAAYPAVSQSVVLVTPAVGTQHLPVLAAGTQTMVPSSRAWMEVTSVSPVVVKQEKRAVTFSMPSTVSNFTNNRYSVQFALLTDFVCCVYLSLVVISWFVYF